MIPHKRVLALLGLCLLSLTILSACETAPWMTKLNAIRRSIMPDVQRQMSEAHLVIGDPTFIRIFKEEALLEIWVRSRETGRYALYKTYPICTFSGKLGPKLAEGDHQAPEGFYAVTMDKLWPQSAYHLAMNISYPNDYDMTRARTGSKIMIHGGCKSEGCFAMTDPVIEEIYMLVESSLKNGHESVPVHIFPFRMSAENLMKHHNSKWFSFWYNIKEGYDIFEQTRIPPSVIVRSGLYTFGRIEG